MSDPEAWRAAIDDAVGELDTEIANVRGIIADVRPAALDELGTGAAVEALAERIRARGIDVTLNLDLDWEAGRTATRHDDELETAVYRLAQEAMTNALKHSGAESLTLELSEADGYITLRVELLGGEFSVASTPGVGTTVTTRLPARRRPAANGADHSLAWTTERTRRSASSRRT
jgi:signal transduction histidine kinase